MVPSSVPYEIAGLYRERTALLESIREGIIAINEKGDVTVMNHQDQADALIGASSSLAEVVEIHNVKEENGMLKMYPVDSLEIPAKGMVLLKPGGYHIMLINLKVSF